jgi:hypothetical protein
MDHLNNMPESVVEDLGIASIETRGIGKGARDGLDEQFPSTGLSDD